MALVRIIRKLRYPDRFSAYQLILDGRNIDRTRAGETKELSVSVGQHELSAKANLYGSEIARFTIISDNQMIAFNVANNVRWLRVYAVRKSNRWRALISIAILCAVFWFLVVQRVYLSALVLLVYSVFDPFAIFRMAIYAPNSYLKLERTI